MATDDPLMDEDEAQESRPKKKSPVIKIIVLVLTMILLVGASVGATLYFTGALSQGADDVEDTNDGQSKKSKKNKAAKVEKGDPTYVQLGDPFVVNFIDNNQIRYLQIRVEVMTREAEMPAKIETHLPLIRNNLVLMFSALDYASISTLAGKQKLRDEALAEIQSILKEETGSTGIEAVYFTSFVMQ